MWMVLVYGISTAFMFLAVPRSIQYPYSMIAPNDTNRLSFTFLGFMAFEMYSKSGSTFMMAADGLTVFSGLLVAAFWLKYAR